MNYPGQRRLLYRITLAGDPLHGVDLHGVDLHGFDAAGAS